MRTRVNMRKFSFRDLCSASDVLELVLLVMVVGLEVVELEVEETVGGCVEVGC